MSNTVTINNTVKLKNKIVFSFFSKNLLRNWSYQ